MRFTPLQYNIHRIIRYSHFFKHRKANNRSSSKGLRTQRHRGDWRTYEKILTLRRSHAEILIIEWRRRKHQNDIRLSSNGRCALLKWKRRWLRRRRRRRWRDGLLKTTMTTDGRRARWTRRTRNRTSLAREAVVVVVAGKTKRGWTGLFRFTGPVDIQIAFTHYVRLFIDKW